MEYDAVFILSQNAIKVLDGYIRYLQRQQKNKKAINSQQM